jgi:hypothetical protein
MASAPRILRDRCWPVRWERGSWARSTNSQLCKKNENCRSESKMIPGNQESQPGATMYRRNMPVAAVAKAVEAAYHSHTAVAERRDDCNMVRRKVPGCALVISMADPASRFKGVSPERTMKLQTQREPREPCGTGLLESLCSRLRAKRSWALGGVQTVEEVVTKHRPRNRFGEETRIWEKTDRAYSRNVQRACEAYNERKW